MGFRVTAAIGLLVLAPACANQTTVAPSGTEPPPPGSATRAEPAGPTTGFVTSIVQEGLADPVKVPGEPQRVYVDTDRSGSFAAIPAGTQSFPLTVHFPVDWTSRKGLTLCGWTEVDGLYDCTAIGALDAGGQFTFHARSRAPHDTYELWLMDGGATRGLRRLLAVDNFTTPWPLDLAFPAELQRVNDVLTKQPPPGGNYLAPVTG